MKLSSLDEDRPLLERLLLALLGLLEADLLGVGYGADRATGRAVDGAYGRVVLTGCSQALSNRVRIAFSAFRAVLNALKMIMPAITDTATAARMMSATIMNNTVSK